MKNIYNPKGITLVALVVTIIVLLILAGIAIGLSLGDNGIIGRAINAKEEYERATRNESEYLENLYSSIKIADNDDAEITINMKELKSIIEETANQKVEEKMNNKIEEMVKQKVQEQLAEGTNGVNSKSLLMSSTDTDLAVGERRLNSFTNTFGEEFEKYFDYNSTNGELICKVAGWYRFVQRTNMGYKSEQSSWSGTDVKCLVNDTVVSNSYVHATSGTTVMDDADSGTLFLKVGDKFEVVKTTKNSKLTLRNDVVISIIKI